jgi:hypothetical protein
MNVGIGTVAAQFFFWEYLFRIFGIVSLQCISMKKLTPPSNLLQEAYSCFPIDACISNS